MCDVDCARSIVGVMDIKGKLPTKWLYINGSNSIGDELQGILCEKGFHLNFAQLKTAILNSEFFKEADERCCFNEDGPEELRFSAVYILSPKAKKVIAYYPEDGHIDEKSVKAKIGAEIYYVVTGKLERVAEFSKRKQVDFESLEMKFQEKLERRRDKKNRKEFPDRFKEETKESIEVIKNMLVMNGVVSRELKDEEARPISSLRLLEDTLFTLEYLLKKLSDSDVKKFPIEERLFNIMEIYSVYKLCIGMISALSLTGAFVFKTEKDTSKEPEKPVDEPPSENNPEKTDNNPA